MLTPELKGNSERYGKPTTAGGRPGANRNSIRHDTASNRCLPDGRSLSECQRWFSFIISMAAIDVIN
jgi:hypothetical protein